MELTFAQGRSPRVLCSGLFSLADSADFGFPSLRKENSLSGGVGGETAPLVERGPALLEPPEPRFHKESAHAVPDATLSKSAKGENDDVT